MLRTLLFLTVALAGCRQDHALDRAMELDEHAICLEGRSYPLYCLIDFGLHVCDQFRCLRMTPPTQPVVEIPLVLTPTGAL